MEKLNLNNLSLKSLEKIFLVLDDIKYNSEIQNSTSFILMNDAVEVEGLSKLEHARILTTIIMVNFVEEVLSTEHDYILKFEPIKFNKNLKSVINRIDELKTGKPKIKNTKKQLKYDATQGILFINDYEIKIPMKGKKIVAQDVLEYFFISKEVELTDEVYYSEIACFQFGDQEYNKDENAWRRYYTACMDIQDKIRKQTSGKIENFLIYNSSQKGSVKINLKYLI